MDLILSPASPSARKSFILRRLGTDEIKACTFTYLLSLAWEDGIFKDLASLDMFLIARPLSEMESLELTIEEKSLEQPVFRSVEDLTAGWRDSSDDYLPTASISTALHRTAALAGFSEVRLVIS